MFAADTLHEAGFTRPRAGEALVLLASATDFTGEFNAARMMLDDSERARAGRFRFARDADTYLVAHALWRSALSLALGTHHVPLTFSEAGQPMLPGTGLATSLSHTGHFIAIAIAMAATVGLDIERDPPRRKLQALAPSICTPREHAAVMALAIDTREDALLALWTRKEALLKAYGTGLRMDPATIDADGGIELAHPGHATLRIHALDTGPSLKGALAAPLHLDTVTTLPLARVLARPVTPDGLSRSYVQPIAPGSSHA
ncbi:4'-phosphopantetheinyl transferase family protein [Pinirhizobacter soli]|uniref:4'-phosphopantetheinyl transferase family protein n=1 Tax=Pinirhizobacter soli TaxID=2786953 RepID=UPI00202A7395|nr:4'-phosphopantetheinyl transferase superfamily protein [Pinirhizobacter soli]